MLIASVFEQSNIVSFKNSKLLSFYYFCRVLHFSVHPCIIIIFKYLRDITHFSIYTFLYWFHCSVNLKIIFFFIIAESCKQRLLVDSNGSRKSIKRWNLYAATIKYNLHMHVYVVAPYYICMCVSMYVLPIG